MLEPEQVGDRSVVWLTFCLMVLSFIHCSHVWLFEGAEGGKWLENLTQDVSGKDELRDGGKDVRETKKARVD
jgi:hypothetical protein